jgi:hypothetical protein
MFRRASELGMFKSHQKLNPYREDGILNESIVLDEKLAMLIQLFQH